MYSILYVDDDAELLVVNKLLLENTGEFSVETISSAQEALERIKTIRYDAIVSDYQMPGMDGIDFLKYVRSGHGNIPFLLFTGKGREEIVIDALNNGADFYIRKGTDMKSMLAELRHKLVSAIERRRTETALNESRQIQNDIINFLPDATFVIDTKGTVVSWNNAIEKMTGVKKADIIGKGEYQYAIPFFGRPRPILIDLVHRDHPDLEAGYFYFKRDERTIHAELSIPSLNGKKGVYLWLTAGPLYDLSGNLTGAIESIRDMSDVQKIRHDLSIFRRMNQDFADLMPVMVYEMDLKGTLTFTNSRALELFGVTWDDFNKKINIFDYISTEDRERAASDIRGSVKGTKSTGREYRLMRKDKTTFPGLIYGSPVIDPDTGKYTGVRGIIIDMTEKKEIARTLHEARERLDLALVSGKTGVWDLDLSTSKIIAIGEWFLQTLGYDAEKENFTLDTLLPLIHPDDITRLKAAFYDRVINGQPFFEYELRMLCRNQTWKQLFIRGKVIEWDSDGQPAHITGTVNDISSTGNS
ncbi:MAG TPA: PAS domain-containing protein [Methanoregula sp.]|mgnify:CR=1 FL=1|nr:PAS domain-containing protein [Methanoregula sp.]